jgi:hypothetical protein
MPSKVQHPKNMTTEQAVKHLFHPRVVQHLKKEKDAAAKPPLKKA